MQFSQARAICLEIADRLRLSSEIVPTHAALGRVTAEVIRSQVAVPRFRNSSMDGFALRAAETTDARTFRICGSLFPGDLPPPRTEPLRAWEITTGAPLPLDCDVVVKVEDVQVTRDEHGGLLSFEISRSLEAETNIRAEGGDYRPGDVVIEAGVVLSPRHLMALAAVDLAEVRVAVGARVVLLPTGRELYEPGEPRRKSGKSAGPGDVEPLRGGIPNSTAAYLRSALVLMGVKIEVAPVLRDEPFAFREFLEKLLLDPPDLLVTTGAVSMGSRDFVREGLEALGAEILFHRVQIRPGKPILFARFQAAAGRREFAVFGLPGNPISTVVGQQFFIEPYLRQLQGAKGPPWRRVRLAGPVSKPAELRCFFRGQWPWQEDTVQAAVLQEQGSSLVRPLLDSTAWVILPEGQAEFAAGEWVDVLPISFEL